MSSHYGTWNTNRIVKIKDLIDGFNSILIAPIYKGDCIDITLIGINRENTEQEVPIIGLSRTSATHNKKEVSSKKDGVFLLKSYDEDMIYAMAALFSAFGHSIYLPVINKNNEKDLKELIKIAKSTKKVIFTASQIGNPRLNLYVKFIEFSPVVKFAENNIASVQLPVALDFCKSGKQPDIFIPQNS